MTTISRNAEKCAGVAVAIKSETGNPGEYIQTDISTLAGIQQDAATFLRFHQQCHILVNNVVSFFIKRTVISDGFESSFFLNLLNYYLFTTLHFDQLKTRAPARAINVSSRSDVGARINFEDLQGEKRQGGFRAYGQSKLAHVLFIYKLPHRLEDTREKVNALHPGYEDAGIPLSSGFLRKKLQNFQPVFLPRNPKRCSDFSIPGPFPKGRRRDRGMFCGLQANCFQSRILSQGGF